MRRSRLSHRKRDATRGRQRTIVQTWTPRLTQLCKNCPPAYGAGSTYPPPPSWRVPLLLAILTGAATQPSRREALFNMPRNTVNRRNYTSSRRLSFESIVATCNNCGYICKTISVPYFTTYINCFFLFSLFMVNMVKVGSGCTILLQEIACWLTLQWGQKKLSVCFVSDSLNSFISDYSMIFR